MLKNKQKKLFTFSNSHPAKTKWYQKISENLKSKLLEIYGWRYKTSLDTTESKIKKSESRIRQKDGK